MNRASENVPAARTTGLVTTQTANECLVYDQESHHIHHLDQWSATVWRHCSGDRTLLEIAVSSGLDVEAVGIALARLSDANLLAGELPATHRVSRSSRRTFLRKGGAAVAIPTVISVTAPIAAQATSNTSRYYKCSNAQCDSQTYCPLQCGSSTICPAGCTKDIDNTVCQVFDAGSAIPPMCGVWCACP